MTSTLITSGVPAPHRAAADAAHAGAGKLVSARARLQAELGRRPSVPLARPGRSAVYPTELYPRAAATHIPAAAIKPASAYNKAHQVLGNSTQTVPVSIPWRSGYAETVIDTAGKAAQKALAEPSLEDVAEEVAFALKRAVSDADKDKLEDQLETLRALAAVKKRRGELSPEQQRIVREIALEVERRHETAAAEAESSLMARRDVEAENLAAGQAVAEEALEAKRGLQAALHAEAVAAGLEGAKEDALAEAAEQEGRLFSIATEGEELDLVADQLRVEHEKLSRQMDRLSNESPRGYSKKRKALLKREITKTRTRLEANEAQRADVEKRIEAVMNELDSTVGVYEDEVQRAQSIEERQKDASSQRRDAEDLAEQAAEEVADFTPQAAPVRRPHTRSQTRRQQKTAELSRTVTRSMTRQQARQAGPEFVVAPGFENLLGVVEAFETPTTSRHSRSREYESKYDDPGARGPDPAQMTGIAKKDLVLSLLRSEISGFNPAANWNRTQTFNVLQKNNRMDLLPSLQPYL